MACADKASIGGGTFTSLVNFDEGYIYWYGQLESAPNPNDNKYLWFMDHEASETRHIGICLRSGTSDIRLYNNVLSNTDPTLITGHEAFTRYKFIVRWANDKAAAFANGAKIGEYDITSPFDFHVLRLNTATSDSNNADTRVYRLEIGKSAKNDAWCIGKTTL